ARRELHDAGADIVGDHRAGKAGAARARYLDDVAGRYAPRPGVPWMDAQGLAPCHLARAAMGAEIELAVEAGRRLVGHKLQRPLPRNGTAQALLAVVPARMAAAVGVVEAGNAL